MYVTEKEIRNLIGNTAHFGDAYISARSMLVNNYSEHFDLDIELEREGATRNVKVLSLFICLILLNMALLGNKSIDYKSVFSELNKIINFIFEHDELGGKNANTDFLHITQAEKTAFSEKQNAFVTQSITITVADWSGGTTAVKTVTGVTTTSFNSICANKDNSDLLGEFGVIGDSQAADEITFKADETPTSDISLTVVIFE